MSAGDMAEIKSRRTTIDRYGEWRRALYTDHVEELMLMGLTKNPGAYYTIERVLGKKSRRKRWVVVNRGECADTYGPKIAGPFKALRQAKAMYITLARMT